MHVYVPNVSICMYLHTGCGSVEGVCGGGAGRRHRAAGGRGRALEQHIARTQARTAQVDYIGVKYAHINEYIYISCVYVKAYIQYIILLRQLRCLC